MKEGLKVKGGAQVCFEVKFKIHNFIRPEKKKCVKVKVGVKIDMKVIIRIHELITPEQKGSVKVTGIERKNLL